MTDTLIKPTPFPGGLADASWRYACVRDRLGRSVAVDLNSGAMLWRTTGSYRPLLAATEELVALAEEDFRCAAIVWEKPAGGSPRWTSDPLPLPEWAHGPGADLEFSAKMRGSTIEIAWTARTRYKGGASPSEQVLEQSTRDAQGAFAIDRASGAVSPIASTEADFQPELSAAEADPDVLQQARHGDRIYQLVVERDADVVRTALRALDASGRTLWRLIVDEGPARAPRARRA